MFVAVQPRVPTTGPPEARDRDARIPSTERLDARLQEAFPDAAGMLTSAITDPESGLTLHAWLRLDNAAELAAELGIDCARDAAAGPGTGGAGEASAARPEWGTHNPPTERFARDAALVLAAYRTWGADCAAHLEGDFAVVILDPRAGTAYAARDAVGIRPLYYAITPELFAASPTAAVFDLIPGVDTSVRDEWLADFVHGMSGDWSQTPLAGVRRLPPGHWLQVTPHEVVERRYHRFDDTSPWEDTRDPQWLEDYRDALIRAVSVRTDPDGLIGVETSGGIDSSTILGVMAHTHPERIRDIHTFGFAYLEDEPGFILETSAAHGIRHNHIITAAAAADHQRGWRAIGYPTEHGNAVAHMPFYSLAAQLGARTLHSGHGGDEIVTNTGGLALQELIERRQWRQVLRDLPGPAVLRPARLAKRLTRRSGDVSHLTAPMMSRLEFTPLSADVVEQRDMARRTFERARYDAPHSRVNDFVLGDRVSAMTTIRTADCSLVAASFGVDYRWALLDRRLIQQYLHTPSVWKYGEGYGRYLHRRAISGIVPDKVAWKRGKYMGEPRGAWLRQVPVEQEVARRAVDGSRASAGEVLERLHPRVGGLVDPQRLHTVVDRAGRWTRAAGASGGSGDDAEARASARYLSELLLLSNWLNDRDSRGSGAARTAGA